MTLEETQQELTRLTQRVINIENIWKAHSHPVAVDQQLVKIETELVRINQILTYHRKKIEELGKGKG